MHCHEGKGIGKMRSKSSSNIAHRVFSKVPEITIYFWIIKILTTAMGEATSDFLVFHTNKYLAVILGTLGFLVALVLQFKASRYSAWVYWLLVVMVSIFGTMVADVIHVVLGVPYAVSTCGFTAVLAVILALWYRVEGTLSIHSIYTRRREFFYWSTVLATFALGTASGDMTAATLHLGYLISGVVFAMLFIIPGVGYWLLGFNDIFAFWCAYIITRPLGASFADWFDKPATMSGLGYGTPVVSIILTVFILIFVAYVAVTRIDVGPELSKDQPAIAAGQTQADMI
jgi:uncharacterized membrane-anchored protein